MKIIDDPTPFVIDVLRMELEQKLPYWLSKGLKEDAEPVNHTGAGIATFDPLLARRKRRERFFKRKPVLEADVESLPMSGGPGEADMNSVVPKKKFRIRHRKPLRETYNPNEPREPRGTPHGGRWTRYRLDVGSSQVVNINTKSGDRRVIVYLNPTKTRLKAILEKTPVLRGIVDEDMKNWYVWDAKNAIHMQMAMELGFGYDDVTGEFSFSKEDAEAYGYNLKKIYNERSSLGVGDEMWSPDPEPKFVEFPPIKMGEEDKTISKETIDKLHLTEDDLKARRRVLTQGNEDKSEHLIAFDDVGWENLTSNALTHVSLPDTLVETLRNSVARYTMVHNHPWDSSLSGGDLNIAAFPGVKRMFAHVATGSIYSVEQTQLLRDVIKYSPKKYQNLWDAMGISARTINEILSPFNPEFNLEMLAVASQDNYKKLAG